MRKLAVMCLAAFALAGATQWIAPTTSRHYAIPDPKPAILPFAPDLFMPAVDTLKYDDNMAANAWAQNQAGGGWGVKFISPGDNVTLTGALIDLYDTSWPVPGGDRAMVKVFADDGPGGMPGTELWASDTLTLVRGQFNYVTIGTPVVASNFYIFYVQPDSYPDCPGMAVDVANNAPGGRKWSYGADGSFSPDNTEGDWMIRAVLDWTPQDHNAGALYFASNMTSDTVPNINFSVKVMIKNFGNSELPVGTPVRLRIDGPSAYVYQDTFLTTSALQRGQTGQLTFAPAWHIPNVAGDYVITAWTEAAGEEWPANDTITWTLSAAQWIEYFDEAGLNWISWAGPQRSVQFDPSEFSLTYPVGLTRVRADFYYHSSAPWPDSSFQFRIYGDDGETELYASPILEAIPGTPGPFVAHTLDSVVVIPSGTFYVAVDPISSTNHPSFCSDGTTQGKSFYGSPGSWNSYTNGEYFVSASGTSNYGVAEEPGFDPSVRGPSLKIVGYPNPARGVMNLSWQVPTVQQVDVNLYDAAGRLARSLYSGTNARLGSTSLDTRTLAAGIYLVRLETGHGNVTRKVVIER